MLLGLEHLGALQMADLGGEPLHRARHYGKRHEILRVPVARDHLSRDGLWPQAQSLGHIGFDPGVHMGEGPDHARDGAGANLFAHRPEPLSRAGELGIGISELEPEGCGLCMHPMSASDGRRVFVLKGARLQRGKQGIDVGDE